VNEQLWDVYEQTCMIELQPLSKFVRRVRSGEHGIFSREDVRALLRQVQDNMLAMIHLKASEGTQYADQQEDVALETERMFEQLYQQLDGDAGS